MMNDKQIKQIESILKSNNKDLTDGLGELTKKFDEYVDLDIKWKKQYEPYLIGLENLSGSAKILIAIGLTISAILGAIIATKSFFKH